MFWVGRMSKPEVARPNRIIVFQPARRRMEAAPRVRFDTRADKLVTAYPGWKVGDKPALGEPAVSRGLGYVTHGVSR